MTAVEGTADRGHISQAARRFLAAMRRLAPCARARAWLHGRDYVSPDDIHATIHDVLRHRVLLSYEAEADGVSVDELTDRLLDLVPVP